MQINRRSTVLLLSLSLVGTSMACTSTQQSSTTVDTEAGETACFNSREVLSFSGLHDRFVYVKSRRDKHYLLTMDRLCLNLRHSVGIAISNDFGRVCSNSGAWITYKDFNRASRCGILTVESVESRDEAQQLVERRTQAKAKKDE
ncbi:MAG: hypothetical protein GY906_08790 [bacterium]|nr:hypothetical protein [bacterium]